MAVRAAFLAAARNPLVDLPADRDRQRQRPYPGMRVADRRLAVGPLSAVAVGIFDRVRLVRFNILAPAIRAGRIEHGHSPKRRAQISLHGCLRAAFISVIDGVDAERSGRQAGALFL